MQNTLKRLFVVILSVVICIFSVSTVCAASSPDQSILTTAEDDKFEPLYTVSPENSALSSGFSDPETFSKNYTLFYTQTTFLALLAGYLIIYKIKGIDHSQKMHISKNIKED